MCPDGDETKLAKVLEEVRVRKRTWRRDDLDPRVEKVQYLCPSVENLVIG